jgi:hypothetical protein
MSSIRELADHFVGMAAQVQPEQQSEVLRQAAYEFMGLSQKPQNARSAEKLARIGLDFANAASRQRPPTMDDFTDLLQGTEQAYDETGDDVMNLISRRRELYEERVSPTPGAVSIAPDSFNKDATLGRSAVIKFAPTQEEIAQGILQSQNIAFWQGTKKEAQAMTVDISLGFLPPLQDDSNLNVRPYAEVEYGSDGNRTKVKMDVAFGKRVTVVGNYIAVTIGTDAPRPVGPGLVGETIALTAGASIGAFAAPSVGPVILTSYIDFLEPVNEVIIPIPLKAVALLPIQSDLALGQTATLEFLDYGATNIMTQVFYTQVANPVMQPIPITGDVAFILVRNGLSIIAKNFRLPFQLAM